MTTPLSDLEKFYAGSDLTPEQASRIVSDGLRGTSYGEMYREIVASESLTFRYGVLTAVKSRESEGFGFRAGCGDKVGYAHSDIFTRSALKRAVSRARETLHGYEGVAAVMPKGRTKRIHAEDNRLQDMPMPERIAKMQEMHAFISGMDPRITYVGLVHETQVKDVLVITGDGRQLTDHRPLTRLNINVEVSGDGERRKYSYASIGGPVNCRSVFNGNGWKNAAHGVLSDALALLDTSSIDGGQMDVVLGPGGTAVILHEAVGHGLESDHTRIGDSVYTGRLGQRIAADGVTLVDAGNLPGMSGSLRFDDEGVKTQESVLIENGILMKYMQDRKNAHMTGVSPTGNGRRQDHTCKPLPRMTNTYLQPGPHDPQEIIASVRNGLYVSRVGDGSVTPASGEFAMDVKMARVIRDGKICEPAADLTLHGNGPSVIRNISMIGTDFRTNNTDGNCEKDGQSVTVTMGQPTIRVRGLSVIQR